MAPDVMRLIGLLHTLCVHSTASASNYIVCYMSFTSCSHWLLDWYLAKC